MEDHEALGLDDQDGKGEEGEIGMHMWGDRAGARGIRDCLL